MNNVEIHLQDVESGEVYQMKLSPADAVRAENDISEPVLPSCSSSTPFMKQNIIPCTDYYEEELENRLREEQYDANLGQFPEEIKNNLEESAGENFRWPNKAVLLLLEEYRTRENDMSSGKITHKKAWDKISEAMSKEGYTVTGRQCSTRFNTMKRTYKGIKDHNNKSGNNKRTWPYYEIMDNLLGSKPYMSPIATMSSTGTDNSEKCSSSASNSSTSCSMDVDDCNVPRKRKKNDIASAILESRTINEEGKERRHKERMELKMKLMEKLDQLFDKI